MRERQLLQVFCARNEEIRIRKQLKIRTVRARWRCLSSPLNLSCYRFRVLGNQKLARRTSHTTCTRMCNRQENFRWGLVESHSVQNVLIWLEMDVNDFAIIRLNKILALKTDTFFLLSILVFLVIYITSLGLRYDIPQQVSSNRMYLSNF